MQKQHRAVPGRFRLDTMKNVCCEDGQMLEKAS